MSEETFLFDDFFVAVDDPGLEEVIAMRGRQVPIRIKRDITLGDFGAAQTAAMRTHLAPNGQTVVDGVDQTVLAVELLARVIKSWPFTYADGSPVPVNRPLLYQMTADAANGFEPLISKLLKRDDKAELGPFESPSGAAS